MTMPNTQRGSRPSLPPLWRRAPARPLRRRAAAETTVPRSRRRMERPAPAGRSTRCRGPLVEHDRQSQQLDRSAGRRAWRLRRSNRARAIAPTTQRRARRAASAIRRTDKCRFSRGRARYSRSSSRTSTIRPNGYIEPLARCAPAGVPKSFHVAWLRDSAVPGLCPVPVQFGYAHHPSRWQAAPARHVKLWNADSRGRWEGNTLIVDVRNNNAKARLARTGEFFSDNVDRGTLHLR